MRRREFSFIRKMGEILEKSSMKRFWKNHSWRDLGNNTHDRFWKYHSWDILETSPTICFGNIFPTNSLFLFWKQLSTICFGNIFPQFVLETPQTHSQLLLCHQGLVKWKSGWLDPKHVSQKLTMLIFVFLKSFISLLWEKLIFSD